MRSAAKSRRPGLRAAPPREGRHGGARCTGARSQRVTRPRRAGLYRWAAGPVRAEAVPRGRSGLRTLHLDLAAPRRRGRPWTRPPSGPASIRHAPRLDAGSPVPSLCPRRGQKRCEAGVFLSCPGRHLVRRPSSSGARERGPRRPTPTGGRRGRRIVLRPTLPAELIRTPGRDEGLLRRPGGIEERPLCKGLEVSSRERSRVLPHPRDDDTTRDACSPARASCDFADPGTARCTAGGWDSYIGERWCVICRTAYAGTAGPDLGEGCRPGSPAARESGERRTQAAVYCACGERSVKGPAQALPRELSRGGYPPGRIVLRLLEFETAKGTRTLQSKLSARSDHHPQAREEPPGRDPSADLEEFS